ncbi:MAG: hypothetical protein ACOCUV_04100 [bacterium]
MKNFLSYIYYRVYKVFEYINGKSDNPHITTLLYFTFMILFLLDIFLRNFQNTKSYFLKYEGILYLIIIGIISSSLYFLTIYKSKYKNIINKFRHENYYIKILSTAMIVTVTIIILVVAFLPILKMIISDSRFN